MRIEYGQKLDFRDVMFKPKRSVLRTRSEVDLRREMQFRYSDYAFNAIPVIAANMDTVGTFAMARALGAHGLCTALHKHYHVNELAQFFNETPAEIRDLTFVSIGITDADQEKYRTLMHQLGPDQRPRRVCIDVANGYSEAFVEFVRRFRDDNPRTTVMAGNVVTNEMTEALILGGVDIVKVGIGPGSVCTTRVKTGVGYPQLSAAMECADAAHGLGGHICSDGGCTVPGDVSKAFGGGADFVMLGGMFAGHDECDGDIVDGHDWQASEAWKHMSEAERDMIRHLPGAKRMKFYGMSSRQAMQRYAGGVADYRASEGKCVEVPYRGPVEHSLQDILGGMRSTCTYVGASRLKDLPKCTTFIRTGAQENRVFGGER